jgi:hypothetical protein
MTTELTAPVAGDTSAAQEATNRRLSALKGLRGAWVEYPDAETGQSIFHYVLQDPDELDS